ncbi:Piwi domain-containing protein [Russula compacta]|nr:Piwi domain-containing protein [Russula compacta]
MAVAVAVMAAVVVVNTVAAAVDSVVTVIEVMVGVVEIGGLVVDVVTAGLLLVGAAVAAVPRPSVSGALVPAMQAARLLTIIKALQTDVEERLSVQPSVYDGRNNFFTSFDLEFESGPREAVPMASPASVEGGRPPQEFRVRLTHVTSINPEVLQHFVKGERSHDNDVLTAIMHEIPIQQAFLFHREKNQTHRWRNSTVTRILSIRATSNRPPGRLVDLALEFLNRPGRPDALSPRHGLPEREHLRLQQFISGIKVITPCRSRDPDAKRLVKNSRHHSRRRFGDITVIDPRRSYFPPLIFYFFTCFRAGPQYYANLRLKVNVKLGGINTIPDVSYLDDPINPTIVMGGGHHTPSPRVQRPAVIHFGSWKRRHYWGQIYTKDWGAVVLAGNHRGYREHFGDTMGKFPKCILFYRDGVSEGEFTAILGEELSLIRSACEQLHFEAKITTHHHEQIPQSCFFPTPNSAADRCGNCPAGTIVDTGVVSPVETTICMTMLGCLARASRLTTTFSLVNLDSRASSSSLRLGADINADEYNRILVCGAAESTVFNPSHSPSATSTPTAPAPDPSLSPLIVDARNVCTRAKNHYDPQQGQRLFMSEIATETTDPAVAAFAAGSGGEFQRGFRQTHERMARTMYFCCATTIIGGALSAHPTSKSQALV